MTRITIVYYSSTGSVHALAEAYAAGAASVGAEVRLRRAGELAPREAIDKNPGWSRHLAATEDIPVATAADLVWADGFALGSPTRFGQPAAQLKQFMDTTGEAWSKGHLADKPATAFTSSDERHGGQEATLLALYHTLFHWGSVILPTGYVDYELSHAAGGNPYGVSSIGGDGPPNEHVLALARFQGERLADFARALSTQAAAA